MEKTMKSIFSRYKTPAIVLGFGLALALTTSCENDPYLYDSNAKLYLTGDEKQEAKEDSVFYSFRIYDNSKTQEALNLQAHVIGPAVDRNREFKLEVVDSLTTAPASAYSVGAFVMPAGQTVATVPVTVQRKVDGMNLAKRNAKVTFRVVPNGEFEAGIADQQMYSIVWCDYLTKPSSWGNIEWTIGSFSQARFKFIIDTTGLTDFEGFGNDYNKQYWLLSILKKKLDEYNADPNNKDREEGWPYKDDDGTPLTFK